ncbi:MAG TPA: hypothetical protein VLC51_10325 [Nitrospira sp.]|nr:hypothetical protein [Nitrospira sp.]
MYHAFSIATRKLVPFTHVLYNRGMALSIVFLFIALLHGLSTPTVAHTQGRTSSGPVGASMALLATLQDADVLPPEGTPEANRVIQIVIQFQGLFMKSSDPVVRKFFNEAMESKYADQAEELGTKFRKGGWTSEVVEAVCERYATSSDQERAQLAGPLSHVNMRPADFDLLGELYAKARARFSQQGQDIHQIFAKHRQTMPGGKRFDRKERRNGNQGLYSHQS